MPGDMSAMMNNPDIQAILILSWQVSWPLVLGYLFSNALLMTFGGFLSALQLQIQLYYGETPEAEQANTDALQLIVSFNIWHSLSWNAPKFSPTSSMTFRL